MAPELALKTIRSLPKDAIILDPLSGSGTVLRAGVENGNRCLGFDLDPLAVLMGRVWTSPLADGLFGEARKVVESAKTMRDAPMPWGVSAETQAFAEFWFEERQLADLSALAQALTRYEGVHRDALMLALSRLIITKEKGASIARDTSHSRPHRVFYNNDFDVFRTLPIAAKRIEEGIRTKNIFGNARVQLADARKLPLAAASVDAIITSPPYLNAIDYMRGHRLALIWLGYRLDELASVRAVSIGAEAALKTGPELTLPPFEIAAALTPSKARVVERYRTDIYRLMIELRRVVKPGGQVLVIVGNSNIAGVRVSNADINHVSATQAGFTLVSRFDRALPSQSRYLPTPKAEGNALGRRMLTETVLAFAA